MPTTDAEWLRGIADSITGMWRPEARALLRRIADRLDAADAPLAGSEAIPMGEHTPEPWSYEPEDRTVYGPEDATICEILDTSEGCEGDCPEADANGRLVAAVPELLAACKAAVYGADPDYDVETEEDRVTISLGAFLALRDAIAGTTSGKAVAES